MSDLAGYLVIGLMTGAVYSLIALGIVLVYQSTGVFNISLPWLVPFGAYLAYAALVQYGMPFWLGIPLVLIAAALSGYLIQRLTIQPLLGQSLLSTALMTLGLAVILQGIMVLVWGFDGDVLPRFFAVGGLRFGEFSLSYDHLLALFLSLALVLGMFLFQKYSRAGLAMRVTAESHIIAASLGVKVSGVAALSWILAASVAAVGGVLLGNISAIDTSMLDIGVRAFAVVLLGGLESLSGAILAGLLIGVVETVAAAYLDPYVGGGIRDVAAFAILLIALLVRPYGFFGWKRIERI
ncbi:MAG: branched-chain amino acid ABC transporter permease [Dehalococcoidia bacterium]|nr:branched-chain amino acid ABC transporter permease [Dehalococcoidia bacterium]